MRVFADKQSGKNAEREELRKALDALHEGDTPVVPSVDRLGWLHLGPHRDRVRPMQARHRLHLAARALRYDHAVRVLVFHVFAALAEFIRELIVPGNNESLDAGRAQGAPLGRPLAMTDNR
ncbi:recombinase family protein [Streptomyces sp. NPDC001893]|uniref:recombinase family protein n=1 Tax=Streptomyces sp. NPDC001893 TaxID=3154530 RepID=UPI003323A5B3